MSYPPRNIAAARRVVERANPEIGAPVVISLVGETGMRWPHVFVDPGRSYDYGELRYAICVIATRPGINTALTIAEVYAEAERGFLSSGFPLLVDVENQAVMHVRTVSPLHVRQYEPGSRTWAACFA